MLLTLLLFGCSRSPDPPPTVPPPDAAERLIRLSMMFRGTRPTVEELAAVEADPDATVDLFEQWMESEAFLATIRDMWAEILLVRNDTFLEGQLPALGLLEGYEHAQIYAATSEEPLKLVEYIVSNDLPLTEIVTADYILANDVIALMYGVPYDFDAGGWQLSQWIDDRPRAGLLASSKLWNRWESNGSNFNRGRANMVAAQFLCEDFESRDIIIDEGIDIANEAEVAEAVMRNPGCVSCHQTLDPLAAYFWGYKLKIHRNFVAESIEDGCEYDWSEQAPIHGTSYMPEDHCYPLRPYTVADEDEWQTWDLRPPGYYGQPLHDLADVGEAIALDPRFSECMARQFFGYFTETDPKNVPFETAARLQAALVGSAFDTKAMITAMLREESLYAESNPDGGLLVARPEQYARAVEDLTGFRWIAFADPPDCNSPSRPDVNKLGTQCWGDVDLSVSDLYGFRAMSGGIDSNMILSPTHTVTPTKSIVMSQLAANAAGFVVPSDLARPVEERKLLSLVERETTDEAIIRDQIVALHARVLGLRVSAASPEVDEALSLYQIGAASSPELGWTILLTAMLQDPRMVFF